MLVVFEGGHKNLCKETSTSGKFSDPLLVTCVYKIYSFKDRRSGSYLELQYPDFLTRNGERIIFASAMIIF